jgi:predicted double-glycine peptidase
MTPWIETAAVVLLAAGGFGLGLLCSRLRKPYWVLGYIVPLVLVGLVGAARHVPRLEFIAPFSWLMSGRTEFALLGFLAAMLLATPLSRLPRKSTRGLVVLFAVFAVIYAAVMPFLSPALIRGHLSRLVTRIDDDGVCLQGTTYTCGPAAAVTALRQLGLDAHEGEIAILAHTSAFSGTQPDSLRAALLQRFGPDGLDCDILFLDSIDELRDAPAAIVVVKYRLMVDHYVAVLELTDDTITIGDPLTGARTLTHDQFRPLWRRTALVLTRTTTGGLSR